MDSALCCSSCGEVVIKSMSNGESKLRAKVVLFKSGQTIAVCKGCAAEIPVPVKVDETLAKSIASNKRLKLYVRK